MKKYIQPLSKYWNVEAEELIADSIKVASSNDYEIENTDEILVKQQYWEDIFSE